MPRKVFQTRVLFNNRGQCDDGRSRGYEARKNEIMKVIVFIEKQNWFGEWRADIFTSWFEATGGHVHGNILD